MRGGLLIQQCSQLFAQRGMPRWIEAHRFQLLQQGWRIGTAEISRDRLLQQQFKFETPAIVDHESNSWEVRASPACVRPTSPINMSRREFATGQHEWRCFHPRAGSVHRSF